MKGPGPRIGSRVAILAAAAALLGTGTAAATTTTVVPATVSGGAFQAGATVGVSAGGFTPADVAIVPGATVTWTGPLGTFPLLFDDGTPGATSGTSFSQVFSDAGRVLFHGPDTGAGEPHGSVYVAGPIPKLRATQIAPPDPRVRLDASATDFVAFSPNDSAHYEFDADNDGTFDVSAANPILSFRYPGEGTYTARVRVTDDDGFSAEATTTVTVTRDGVPAEVDRTAPKLVLASLPRLARSALRASPKLALGTPSETVTARVAVFRGRTTIATGTTSGLGQHALAVRLRVTTAGRRYLLRTKPGRATLRITLTDGAGNRTIVRRTLRLRAP